MFEWNENVVSFICFFIYFSFFSDFILLLLSCHINRLHRANASLSACVETCWQPHAQIHAHCVLCHIVSVDKIPSLYNTFSFFFALKGVEFSCYYYHFSNPSHFFQFWLHTFWLNFPELLHSVHFMHIMQLSNEILILFIRFAIYPSWISNSWENSCERKFQL